MIAAVKPTVASAWPRGWEDVEVVDSVLVCEPADVRTPGAQALGASAYDRSGRVAAGGRFGRLVSVLA